MHRPHRRWDATPRPLLWSHLALSGTLQDKPKVLPEQARQEVPSQQKTPVRFLTKCSLACMKRRRKAGKELSLSRKAQSATYWKRHPTPSLDLAVLCSFAQASACFFPSFSLAGEGFFAAGAANARGKWPLVDESCDAPHTERSPHLFHPVGAGLGVAMPADPRVGTSPWWHQGMGQISCHRGPRREVSRGTGILAGAGAEKAFPCRGEEMGLNPLCFPGRDTLIFTTASSTLTYSLSAGS